jgi:hypothetical protein
VPALVEADFTAEAEGFTGVVVAGAGNRS